MGSGFMGSDPILASDSALNFAGLAAEFGNIDALGVLIDQYLNDSDRYISWSMEQYT
jgi:hypothetical protein